MSVSDMRGGRGPGCRFAHPGYAGANDSGMNISASWPGLSRPSTFLARQQSKDVDARDKPGHDGGGAWEYEDALRAFARMAVA
jgi:hypothetical protein